MNATKKTLTTLSVAATLALGGIAVAQTTGTVDSNTGVRSSGSDSSLMNNANEANNPNGSNYNSANPSMNSATPGAASDTSTLGAGPADANQPGMSTYNDTSTLGNNADGSLDRDGGLAPQADRN